MATELYRRRIGAVRPSHVMFTSGVGALVDLPNISAIVLGLDDWNYYDVPGRNVITESRLLTEVRKTNRQVRELRTPPVLADGDNDIDGPATKIGMPTRPFPSYLRCTVCNELAPIETKAFVFENAGRPEDARFSHKSCSGVQTSRKPLAVAARFVLACTGGHLDDFPYIPFVHRGGSCPNAPAPRMRMDDRGGNLGANVAIQCLSCSEQRNIREALGARGEENLPHCRGRHAHLGTFEAGGCTAPARVLVVGASNQWFSKSISVLSVPKSNAGALATAVEQQWETLKGISDRNLLEFTWSMGHHVKDHFQQWSDLDEIWAAVEAHRANQENGPQPQTETDLRKPEWDIFTAAQEPEPSDDFTLHRDPDGVPDALKGVYSDIVQVERLREVRALVGFTRLDAPDPEDPGLIKEAPLAREDVSWVPATEVRGEGLFLRLPEDLLADWESRVVESEALQAHFSAYQQFRRNRFSNRVPGAFDASKNWPGARYYALHTLSHLLIRTIAAECGYSSASLSERIYSSIGEDEARSGILIYTAVPDAEGTLGGLVSLGEPKELTRITRLALNGALHCSSDPLCSERLPKSPADFLHGAACHVCLFISETSCERGNRFLDRRFVVPIDEETDLALFRDLA